MPSGVEGNVDAAAAKTLQSCATLCDPVDSSLPGSPTPGILQARRLEWVAIAFSECGCNLFKIIYLEHGNRSENMSPMKSSKKGNHNNFSSDKCPSIIKMDLNKEA